MIHRRRVRTRNGGAVRISGYTTGLKFSHEETGNLDGAFRRESTSTAASCYRDNLGHSESGA